MSTDRSKAINAYLVRVSRARKRGDATEHTYRPFLQDLIEALAKGVTCINEPKGGAAGHPDFKVALGETPLGFIETKDIDADLDYVENTSQLRRYLKHIPNLILTDYLAFHWYQNGEEVLSCRLGVFTAKGTLRRNPGGEDKLCDIIDNFTQAEVKTIGSPKELAQRMAALAKLTRRHVVELFASEESKGDLHSLLKAFREVLLPDLDEQSFADMYAQTVCYGLFASICNARFPQQFARENAADNLPATNPFLRRLFHHIVGPDLHSKVREDIERVVFLLKHADIGAILRDFGKHTRQEDPVVHFYETFLAQYDPKLRKSRGVYYTPEPVVSYIVRSVDWLLKDKFGKKDGLADPSVIVLDPACGTGTFLYSVIKLIHERVERKGQYGAWNSYVKKNLLPRIFGFELLMAPYAVAHLKLGLLLKDTGYDFSGDERLGVFLTNTLEEAARKSDVLFAQWISEESNAAAAIKKDKPVMVVLGNPPYSGVSANMNTWIDDMLHGRLEGPGGDADYYSADGKPLGEKKLWLQDDYIKFIRWAQWRIERTGSGVLGYVTNHSYLDGPTHRGMRFQLLRAFDDLRLLDLHGSSKKREACPDGSKDQNVFDILPGVAIALLTKERHPSDSPRVTHGHLWGTRDAKYARLSSAHCDTYQMDAIHPTAPFHALRPTSVAAHDEYGRFLQLPKVLLTNVTGIQTSRDHFVVDTDKAELLGRITAFRSANYSDDEVRSKYFAGRGVSKYPDGDTRGWKLPSAREAVRRDTAWASRAVRVDYRPFDTRWLYYTAEMVDWPRAEVMRHMVRGANLGLAVGRAGQVVGSDSWDLCWATARTTELNLFRRGGNNLFPLYLYPAESREGLFGTGEPTDAPGGRRPNLSPEFIKEFSGKLGLEFVPEQTEAVSGKRSADSGLFGPEDVFNYIYAVFHSPTYRKRYAEFLKIDFPRVPLTSSKPLFRKLCRLGAELVALHLMESPKMDKLVTKYPKTGNNAVTKVSYSDETRRVLVNDDQYFSGIRPEEWEFHIGGYQVLAKWLKDRKKAKRKLSADDIRHYQRIVVAIRETIRLMTAIDKAIPEWPIG